MYCAKLLTCASHLRQLRLACQCCTNSCKHRRGDVRREVKKWGVEEGVQKGRWWVEGMDHVWPKVYTLTPLLGISLYSCL